MDIILQRITELIEKKPDGTFKHGAKNVFAQKLGFKDGHIVSDWIAGRNTSYKNYVHQIADTYNVSVEWLKGETDIKEKPTAANGELDEDLQELVALLNDMSDEKLQMMVNYAKFLASQD